MEDRRSLHLGPEHGLQVLGGLEVEELVPDQTRAMEDAVDRAKKSLGLFADLPHGGLVRHVGAQVVHGNEGSKLGHGPRRSFRGTTREYEVGAPLAGQVAGDHQSQATTTAGDQVGPSPAQLPEALELYGFEPASFELRPPGLQAVDRAFPGPVHDVLAALRQCAELPEDRRLRKVLITLDHREGERRMFLGEGPAEGCQGGEGGRSRRSLTAA